MVARTWRILPLGSLLQEACYSTSDIVERDPALFLGGEANGGRQTLDLPGLFKVRASAALAADRENQRLHLQRLEFVITQLMPRRGAERCVTGLRRPRQQSLKAIAPRRAGR